MAAITPSEIENLRARSVATLPRLGVSFAVALVVAMLGSVLATEAANGNALLGVLALPVALLAWVALAFPVISLGATAYFALYGRHNWTSSPFRTWARPLARLILHPVLR